MGFSEAGVKISIAFTLFLLVSFFVFTSYFVLFDSNLGIHSENSKVGSFAGFVVSLQDKGTRDSMVLSLTLVLAVAVFSLVYYWHYKSKTISEDFY